MPNINAALGCAQMEQIQEKLKLKRDLFHLYKSAFKDLKGVSIFEEPDNCKSNYWLQTLLLDRDKSSQRDAILQETALVGYKTRPTWILLNELEPFKDFPSMDTATSKSLSKRIINIPSNVEVLSR
jgi:perosamine synthetase